MSRARDKLDFIVSANVARRHLNAGQLGMVGADLEPLYAAAARTAETQRKTAAIGDRNSHHANAASTRTEADLPQSGRAPQARDKAAKAVGAAGRTVQQAKAVQRDTPDLAEKVRKGELALDAADRERKQRIKTAPIRARRTARPGRPDRNART